MPVIWAAVFGELILPPGLAKLGWLKALANIAWNCTFRRSCTATSFSNAKSTFFIGGPCRISTPAFPNLPILAGLVQIGVLSGQPGTLNAPTLNQLVAVGPPEGVRLAPAMRSGRPPNVLVLEGSKPSKRGVKNW